MDSPGGKGTAFRQLYRVGWGDLDGNQHSSNRAILDRAADTRLLFFAQHGYPGDRFAQERLGPVVTRDEVVYTRELRLLDEFSVDCEIVGLSDDGVRIKLRNTFRSAAGETTAIVTSEGVWFDLDRRRPRPPPPELHQVLRTMPRADRFETLPPRPSRPETSSAGA